MKLRAMHTLRTAIRLPAKRIWERYVGLTGLKLYNVVMQSPFYLRKHTKSELLVAEGIIDLEK